MAGSWVEEFELIYENGGLGEVTQYRSKGLYPFLNFIHNAGRNQIQEHVLEREAQDSLDVEKVVQALDEYSSIVPNNTRGREAEGVRFQSFDDPSQEYLLSPEECDEVYIDFEAVIRDVRDEPEYNDPHTPSRVGGSRSGRYTSFQG